MLPYTEALFTSPQFLDLKAMATKKMLVRLFGTRICPKLLGPRSFPTTGFESLEPSVDIEEETIPGYRNELFYPVRIGEVFQDRFQVVGKLGYGSRSTVWLCHDLRSDNNFSLPPNIAG